MKKLLNISSVGRMIVFVEVLMCTVWTLSVFMVNGADAFTSDHISLLLLVAVTLVSVLLLKARKAHLTKAVLWVAILPMLFLSYETAITFMPYEAQSLQSHSSNLMVFMPIR